MLWPETKSERAAQQEITGRKIHQEKFAGMYPSGCLHQHLNHLADNIKTSCTTLSKLSINTNQRLSRRHQMFIQAFMQKRKLSASTIHIACSDRHQMNIGRTLSSNRSLSIQMLSMHSQGMQSSKFGARSAKIQQLCMHRYCSLYGQYMLETPLPGRLLCCSNAD